MLIWLLNRLAYVQRLHAREYRSFLRIEDLKDELERGRIAFAELRATVEVLTQRNIELQKELGIARSAIGAWETIHSTRRDMRSGEFIKITDNAMHRTQ